MFGRLSESESVIYDHRTVKYTSFVETPLGGRGPLDVKASLVCPASVKWHFNHSTEREYLTPSSDLDGPHAFPALLCLDVCAFRSVSLMMVDVVGW